MEEVRPDARPAAKWKGVLDAANFSISEFEMLYGGRTSGYSFGCRWWWYM